MASIKRGVFWSALERFSVQGIHFLMTLVISRYVFPEEYGLIAMLGIFVAIANSFIDCGFYNALVQKQDRTDTDFSTVFYFNTVVALLMYAVLCLISPFIADFYDEPRLELLTKVICLNLVIRAMATVQNAKYAIAMDFKTTSKASMISAIISGLLGVVLAVKGYGAWALVAQTLSGSLIQTGLLWYFSKWMPSIVFSINSFKRLFGFGSKLMISGMLHTIYLNLYTLVIGKFYTPSDVGYYNRANTFSQYPSTNIVGIVNRVYFPALCEKQNDAEAFSDLFHRYLRMACFIIFPMSIWMAALAEPIIITLITDKWIGAIIPVQILSVAFMLYPILLINNQPLQCLNRTDLFLQSEIIKKIAAVLLLLAALNFGLHILCLSVLAYNIFDTLIIIAYTRKVMNTGYRKQARILAPMFLSSVIMGVVLYVFFKFSPFGYLTTLILGIPVGMLSYYFMCKMTRVHELEYITNMIIKLWKKR